jgi:hypothetical protein
LGAGSLQFILIEAVIGRPEVTGIVGGHIEGEADDRDGQGRQAQPPLRQAVIHQEQEHDQGCPDEEGDVTIGQAARDRFRAQGQIENQDTPNQSIEGDDERQQQGVT